MTSSTEVLRRVRRSVLTPVHRPSWLSDVFAPPLTWRQAAPLVIVAAGTVLALIAATLGFQAAYTDRIAAGVTVMGVELGGRTKAEARALLAAEVAEVGRQPVILQADGREWQFTARDLGMNLDADVLVEDAYGVGREGNPIQRGIAQWGAFLLNQGLGSPPPQFDVERQDGVLRSVAEQIDRPSRDADIRLNSTLDGPTVVVTPEQTGIQVQVEPSARRLRQALAQGVPATIELVLETEQPKALATDFAAARARAERMLAEPVVLTFEERRWSISRDDVARMLSFERAAGQPAQVVVNPSALDTTLQRMAKDVDQPALNARFAWTGSSLRSLRESQDGRTVDLEGLRTMIRDGLLQAEEHAFALPVNVARPAVTTADAPKINVQGLIREGRTSFAGATAEKAHNVGLASSRLNGVVVPPGGLFSFNREVGPTTLDAGFRTGWGITQLGGGARTVPSVAGGICQVATTLFQPVFRSGYMIEERNYHAYWINSYGQPPYGMKGLDATVDEDANLDFQFTNNTGDHLLISSRVEGATLVFGLWGVKPSWDVKIDDTVITNVVTANTEVVNQNEPTMPAGRRLQVESAQDGFTSVITRTVSGAGQETRTLRLTSRYQPARNVILIGTGPG